jgi:hypothetical protein
MKMLHQVFFPGKRRQVEVTHGGEGGEGLAQVSRVCTTAQTNHKRSCSLPVGTGFANSTVDQNCYLGKQNGTGI